eukprot:Nk52_evm44s2192 gene=Nk52_evmTU44s2192
MVCLKSRVIITKGLQQISPLRVGNARTLLGRQTGIGILGPIGLCGARGISQSMVKYVGGKENDKGVVGNILQSAEGTKISAYSTQGIVFRDLRLVGPSLVCLKSALMWNITKANDISVESLTLIPLLRPRVEILVIGTGTKVEAIDMKVREFFRSKGIALEVLDTANACSTYNFLCEEGRVAAAALIPVSEIAEPKFTRRKAYSLTESK